ncbi:hypothetical protein KCU77_g37, partial [Aureobasidium melanogenum]
MFVGGWITPILGTPLTRPEDSLPYYLLGEPVSYSFYHVHICNSMTNGYGHIHLSFLVSGPSTRAHAQGTILSHFYFPIRPSSLFSFRIGTFSLSLPIWERCPVSL